MIEALTTDFNTIPDNSYSFEAEPTDDNFIVIGKKKLKSKKFDLFDSVQVIINKEGKRTIEYLNRSFYVTDIRKAIEFIRRLYTMLGPDESNNNTLSSKDATSLLTPSIIGGYEHILIFWKQPEINVSIFVELNKLICLAFSNIDAANKGELINKYFTPNIVLDKSGMLVNRLSVLNQTEAAVVSEKSTIEKTIDIVKIAGSAAEPYLYSLSFPKSPVALTSELTKLGFSFSYTFHSFFLVVISYDVQFPLNSGDTLSLKFEHGETIDLIFRTDSYISEHGQYKNLIRLTLEQLDPMGQKKLKGWGLLNNRNRAFTEGGFKTHRLVNCE